MAGSVDAVGTAGAGQSQPTDDQAVPRRDTSDSTEPPGATETARQKFLPHKGAPQPTGRRSPKCFQIDVSVGEIACRESEKRKGAARFEVNPDDKGYFRGIGREAARQDAPEMTAHDKWEQFSGCSASQIRSSFYRFCQCPGLATLKCQQNLARPQNSTAGPSRFHRRFQFLLFGVHVKPPVTVVSSHRTDRDAD